MLSFFLRRVVTSRTASGTLAARSPLSALQTQVFAVRRTFLTTPFRAEPAKGTTTAKKAAAGKSTKKNAPKKAVAKRVALKKATPKKVAPKRKPKKAAPPKIKITAEDKPPKQPPTSYMLFVSRFRVDQPTPTNLAEAQEVARRAGAAWTALTEHEKQAFRDENAALRLEYQKARADYFARVDPAKVKLLNQQRAKAGKTRIVIPRPKGTAPRPNSAYIRFALEYRAKNGVAAPAIEAAKQIGAAWRALPDTEKKPYLDKAQLELNAWKAKHAPASSA